MESAVSVPRRHISDRTRDGIQILRLRPERQLSQLLLSPSVAIIREHFEDVSAEPPQSRRVTHWNGPLFFGLAERKK